VVIRTLENQGNLVTHRPNVPLSSPSQLYKPIKVL